MATIDFDQARDLLGVDRHASPDDIRRAYRSLARRHHPDAGGDVATFQSLTAAVDLLVGDAARRVEAPSSPSTGRRAYPSTSGPVTGTGSSRPDTSLLETARVPAPGDPWDRSSVAAAVHASFAGDGSDRVRGVSRGPRTVLNRFARHLSADLLSRWEVGGATRRGRPGTDLEVVATFPPGGRKHVERASLPTGWSTTRNPAATESTFVVRPDTDPATTAVLVANVLDDFCTALAWPLPSWSRPG